MGIMHPTTKSFHYAWEGIKTALKQEPNFRIHAVFVFVTFTLAYILDFNAYEWVILVLTSGVVIVLELLNTALESVVNIVSPEIREEAKKAKDVSAAAVFISAIMASIIGLFLFLPKLLILLN